MKLYEILNEDCLGVKFKFKKFWKSKGYCEVTKLKSGLITYKVVYKSIDGSLCKEPRYQHLLLREVLNDVFFI